MNRRKFLTTTGLVGLSSLASTSVASAAAAASSRQCLELRKYTFASPAQREAFDAFMKDVAVPAFNRAGVRPVGVFQDMEKESPVFVLLPHATLDHAANFNHRLLADTAFTSQGATIIDAPKANAPFQEEESWLMLAFSGMPRVETPVSGPGRIFQLRIYESPSLQTGQKKIEMFNDAGELRIFREVGLAPVFFGETLFGAKMPNLTYMLGFESAEAQKAAWGRFGPHPDWQKLRAMPEYADARVIRGITNIQLRPTPYSQV
jgi:hypothetical protein